MSQSPKIQVFDIAQTNEDRIVLAKIAEQSERYVDMAQVTK